jgi:dolichol-phosphate mannosyltransferase
MVSGNYDCVFGSRFSPGGKVYHYPRHKLFLNRFVNNAVRITFGIPYNDFTNAFKLYKKESIQGLKPFMSPHFNLTLELSLKAVIRGYSFTVLPNSWTNRKFGKSNLKIKEMGSRYFFIFLYCLIEKFFSRGDYHKKN